MNPYSHKIPRKTASRLLLFITLLIISLQVPAQETDEYGWRKSDTQVIGHYSGGNKTVTLTSNASESDLSYTISYNYAVVGADFEQIKREVSGSHYWKHNVNTEGYRGKVRKGTQIRFSMSISGGSGTLSPKYYAKRITFTPYMLKCYEIGGEYKEELTRLSNEQVIKETPLSQSPVLDTTFTVRHEGMYMFTIAGGGMWDGSIKTNKPLKYYPGVPTFNVVVYLLVEGEGSATSSTNTEVVPEPKAKPVDDNVGPPTPPSSSTSPWQPTTILASQCPTGNKL